MGQGSMLNGPESGTPFLVVWIGGLDWWFGFGFEPLVLVEGKWKTPPIHQTTNPTDSAGMHGTPPRDKNHGIKPGDMPAGRAGFRWPVATEDPGAQAKIPVQSVTTIYTYACIVLGFICVCFFL